MFAALAWRIWAQAATEFIAKLSTDHPGLDPGSMFADYLRCFGFRGSPASRGLPGGNSLSFCVAKKKVSKEKGDPAVCVPALRSGQPAVLGPAGAGLELASLRQSPVLIRLDLRSSAHTEGWGMKVGAELGSDAGRRDARSASRRSQWAVMYARGRTTRGQMRSPSIAQRGEGRARGGSGESVLLPKADHRRSVTPVSPAA